MVTPETKFAAPRHSPLPRIGNVRHRTLPILGNLFIAAFVSAIIFSSAVCANAAPKKARAKGDAALREREADFYKMITLPTPSNVMFEAGSLCFVSKTRLAAATRIGDVYMCDNLFDDPPKPKYTLFASGLHEVLGLAWKDGWLYATERPQLTRMKDTDGDGRADLFETVCDGWAIKGDYHEYAFGSHFDRDGNIWVLLTLTGSFTSEDPYRGWAVRVTPDGKMLPTCSGIRSPGGIGFNAEGDVFYCDNQGPWNGADPMRQLVPGEFEGNPTGWKWFDDAITSNAIASAGMKKPRMPEDGGREYAESKKIPELRLPAVYFPYDKMGHSGSGIACDIGGGKFGPFQKQMFVGDQSYSIVMRAALEKVDGRYQGACFPFREGFDSGCLALEFASDGSLFVMGTDRGWGARGGKPYALQRLVWTGETPFEILEMHAKPDGFDFVFTQPVDEKTAADLASYTADTFCYIYHASYGSPEVDHTKPGIKSATVSTDKKTVHLAMDGLVEGHIHEFHLKGIHNADGEPLLHDAAYYTLNKIPAK